MLIYAMLIAIGVFALMMLKDMARHQRRKRFRNRGNWGTRLWDDADGGVDAQSADDHLDQVADDSRLQSSHLAEELDSDKNDVH